MYFEKYFTKYASNILLSNDNEQISYAEIHTSINKRSQVLRSQIQDDKSVIGLSSSDKISFAIDLFALWEIGKIVIPLNPLAPQHDIAQITQNIGIETIIHNDDIQNTDLKNNSPEVGIKDKNNALIILTSGSSGGQKGVLLSFENLLKSAEGTNQFYNLTESDHWYLNLPLYHIAGVMILIRCLISGATVDLFRSDKTSCISLVPTQIYRMIDSEKDVLKLKKLRLILIGGAGMASTLWEKLIDLKLNIAASYGLTESCSQITSTRIGQTTLNAGAVLPNREINIVDNRIAIGGETLFTGYINKRKLIRPFDEQGWFLTQDLGELIDGELVVKGRYDDVFKSGGENINPSEIENHLLTYPEIKHAKVIPIPDEEYGMIAIAFIEGEKKDWRSIIRKDLPIHQVPKHFLELPKLDHGKIKYSKQELIQRAIEQVKGLK